MTRIILVRHGQTSWNKVERIRGQVEVPLDEVGLAQAELAGERVAKEFQPGAIYSSPLQRALQTAAPIARRMHLQVQSLEGFNDMNFGQWQGLSPTMVEERWPEMAHAWLQAPHTVTFPGGESLESLRQRSMAALHDVMARHPEQTIAVVGHTVVNRALLMAVIGLDNSNYWRIGQDNCALNVFRWEAGIFFIDIINDSCHLH